MTENAEEVARKLCGLEKFQVRVRASGAFEVTAESEEEAERKARIQFDWAKYLDSFELVEIEKAEE